MKRQITLIILLTLSIKAYSQNITGEIDWESMQFRSTVTLNLASAGIKLPAGRTKGESLVAEGYTRLIRQALMELQIDSGTTVRDLITNEKGGLTLADLDDFSQKSFSIPYYLSSDMLSMSASYSLAVSLISNFLQKYNPAISEAEKRRIEEERLRRVPRVLNPVTEAAYTGIVIIASEELPAHGMRSSFLPVPCLFPKIWDSEMNLIYDRNMATPGVPVARYSSPMNVLSNTPSGLSRSLEQVAGNRPLRIFARGVFGTKPTDLIIDREDALKIISSEENRSLLTQGKVVIILNEEVLREDFKY